MAFWCRTVEGGWSGKSVYISKNPICFLRCRVSPTVTCFLWMARERHGVLLNHLHLPQTAWKQDDNDNSCSC